jgi:hypothetical protein
VQNQGYTSQDISRVASQVWRELSKTEKEKWDILAQALQEKHAQLFPGYQYMVRSSLRDATSTDSTVSASSGSFSKRYKRRSGRVRLPRYYMSANVANKNFSLQKASRPRGVSSWYDGAWTPNSSVTSEESTSLASEASIPMATWEPESVQTMCTFEPHPFFVALAAAGPEAIERFLEEDADILAGLAVTNS